MASKKKLTIVVTVEMTLDEGKPQDPEVVKDMLVEEIESLDTLYVQDEDHEEESGYSIASASATITA